MSHSRFLAVLGLVGFACGLQLSVLGRRHAYAEPSLSRRAASINGTTLKNTGDITYYASLTLGGDTFSCLIDTGSSDLWVAGSVSNTKDTGATSGVNYAVGNVTGPILTADLEFSGYSVKDQAFLRVDPDSENKAGVGLIGLGPNDGSNIYAQLNTDVGFTVVDRIFLQNTSTPNYITINLGRLQDPTDTYPGNITIGDIVEGFEDVQKQPKLDVTIVSLSEVHNQHFQILLDQDGLIGPDGKSISIKTEVDETSNEYQATAVVDSGFSLTQLPKAAADAIYSRFDGAEYVNIGGVGDVWIVPCELEVNITFKFSGNSYPIHPLDTTTDPALLGIDSLQNSDGDDACIGMFQPFSFDNGDDPTYDMILGMSYLRNTYALLNYGDFIGENTTNKGDPYVQFLSTTAAAEAHTDFVTVRLNGIDTTGDQTLGKAHSGTTKKSGFNKNIIIGICGALLVIGIALMAYGCYARRRNRKSPQQGPVYRPLASPQPPVDMSIMQPAPPRYSNPPQYPAQGTGYLQTPMYDDNNQNRDSYRESYASYDSQQPLYDPHAAPQTRNPAYHNPFDQHVQPPTHYNP